MRNLIDNNADESLSVNVVKAKAFIERFPLNIPFSVDKFDTFGIDHGYFPNPGAIASKNEANHKRLLSDRHDLKLAINRGGVSDALEPADRFQIVVEVPGTWVAHPIGEASASRVELLPARVKQYFANRTKDVSKLISSSDIDQLSPLLQRQIEAYQDALDDAKALVDFQLDRTITRNAILRHRMTVEARRLLSQGVHLNGGLVAFIGAEALTAPEDE
jgi:hypothetical protein